MTVAADPGLAEKLELVLPRLLQALPADWESDATTYDLPRFYEEAAFLERFKLALNQILSDNIHDPVQLRDQLADCGHPYDYARLGQPLSTLYELYLQAKTGAKAISFASASKPWLAVLEARPEPLLTLTVYSDGELQLSADKRKALKDRQVSFHENWQGEIPASDHLTVFVSTAPFSADLLSKRADALSFSVPDGGVLLIYDLAKIQASAIQLIRKRTVAALLVPNAKAELSRIAGLSPEPQAPAVGPEDCDKLLQGLFPEIHTCVYFCTGLAAEAAVFTATAQITAGAEPLKLFFAQNGYGGTGQLITDILPREGQIQPMPLQVLGNDEAGNALTLVDRFIAELPALGKQAACLFVETPTNPELQVHDFPRLMTALHEHEARTGVRIPVLVDTTLAPLYPLFSNPFSQNWPFILVKSGSKYFTKGKATLGVVCCAAEPTALAILQMAKAQARDADAFAKSTQLAALSAGLADLKPRMQQIANNTHQLADGIKASLTALGHDVTLYAMSETQVSQGLASGILSFYLPAAPSSHDDLVDEFVDYLLTQAPELVKNRVSYGQSTGDGRPDVFYVINPQESTQGSLPDAVKAAQKKDNVQICRISVPEHADVQALLAVMNRFFKAKYA